ncbi:MAG: hypothetical protein H6821_11185 [Planctomycetaceae bacterium]|nr:hypothetical protein [Planctomycetaceae bacterium]
MPRPRGNGVNTFEAVEEQNSLSAGCTKRFADLAESGGMDTFRQVTIRVEWRNRNRPSPLPTMCHLSGFDETNPTTKTRVLV